LLQSRDTLGAMPRVYGDSTPFPHDIDYIHMLRDGVDCAVRLLAAQYSIRVAEERADCAERAMRSEVTELNTLFDRVQSAVAKATPDGMEIVARACGQIATGARAVVDGAIRELEAQVGGEVSQSGHTVDKAREATASAIEQFLERHAPPESRLCLQLTANPELNAGHVNLVTPYGVTAVFGVAIPPTHAWARPRRVADFAAHVEIQMPKESGFLSKRVEMAPLRIERLFISDVSFAERSGMLRLRKGPGTGSGYEVRIDLDTGVEAAIWPVREDGAVDDQPPLVLHGNDQATMLSLWQDVVQSAADLMYLRQRMLSAAFNGRPLLELDAPRLVAEALINHMAPIISEISRRSGAPGELVLRRNLSEGRREETYCTHAELLEKIMTLPPDMRAVFSALHLTGQHASALSPAAGAVQEFSSRPPLRSSHNVAVPPDDLAGPANAASSRANPPPESSPPPDA
jgi:hypothetical protein